MKDVSNKLRELSALLQGKTGIHGFAMFTDGKEVDMLAGGEGEAVSMGIADAIAGQPEIFPTIAGGALAGMLIVSKDDARIFAKAVAETMVEIEQGAAAQTEPVQ